MRAMPILLLLLALAGCAVAPPAAESDRFFADRLFRAPAERVDAAKVFEVNDAMRRYLATRIGAIPGGRSRQQALMDALRREGELRLEYDAEYTRTAGQAFEARTGNCLSLVILTAALAKEMGIPVTFREVFVEETFSRRGNLQFAIGHVNLSLGGRPPALGSHIDDGEQLIVDFLPPADLRGVGVRALAPETVVAMYMNNRAAESLTAGRPDDAYWFAREAIRQAPSFMAAYNTLGVVYRRQGHLDEAERVLAWALERDPRNTRAMSNLAAVYSSQGRLAQARALEQRLAQLEPEPPFAYFERGLAAMRAGDYRAAREQFAREVDRAPYYHEFHFWLALALANLGEPDRAREHLVLAKENSTTRREHDLYAAKLERIRSARPH